MTGPARPPSTQPIHCSEDDYTHTFASDSSFYSAGDWIGSLPTGAMTPLHHTPSVSGSEIYMPATFDPREANTFLIPTPQLTYSDPTTPTLPPTTSYYGSPGSTASEPAFLTTPQSSTHTAVSGEGTNSQSPEVEKKPKRNRANRYKNAHPAVLSRRRAQNRESQRAYRRRKDDRIAELEQLLSEATDREHALSQAYIALKAEYDQLLVMGGGISQGGRTDGDDMSGAGLLSSSQQVMISMPYSSGVAAEASGSTKNSTHDNQHLHHPYSSSPGVQFPSARIDLDGLGSNQLLAQLRSTGDLVAKESFKMEFGKQLLQQA